ncbi:MAG: magnesium transporter [Candidatus Thermoplasmatota archaeon]|nr:magnesium transporter [Candidatus Thermoplasmatota archaeon]
MNTEKRKTLPLKMHAIATLYTLFLKKLSQLKNIPNDFKESFLTLLLCIPGGLLSGIIIGVSTSSLEVFPALIILIPGAIDMRGNIFASFGSRLGTYLHTGQISPSFKRVKILDQNIASSFILTMFMSTYLGLLASILAKVVGLKVDVIDMLLVSILGGVFSAFFMLIITVVIAFLSFRKGWNPDNVTSPIITLAGDILTLPLLFISLSLVLMMPGMMKLGFFIILLVLTISSFMLIFYHKCKPFCKRIVLESIPVFFFCGLLSTFSGSILGGNITGLISIAGLFTIIPAFLEHGGAMGGILSSKFSSALHLGTIQSSKNLSKPSKEVIHSFLIMHVQGLIIFSLLGSFAFLVNIALNLSTPSILHMILVCVIAGELLLVIINFVSYYSCVLSYKSGLDPDNIVIPLITSSMDVVGTSCLVGTIIFLGII